GPELAWAYANLADTRWRVERTDEAFGLMERASDLGARLGQAGVVSYALTWRGGCLIDKNQDGTGLLEQGLAAALNAGLQEGAGLAYNSLQGTCLSLQRLEEAQRYYTQGMAFCEGRELRFFTRCMRGCQADTLLLLGRWDEAAELCEKL